MLCQRCFKKQASLKISRNYEGKQIELMICKSCSKGYGLEVTISNLPHVFTGIISSILKHKQEEPSLDDEKSKSRCSACGYDWQDFRKTGLLGCDSCYESFKDKILVLQKKVIKKSQLDSKPYISNRTGLKKKEKAILKRALDKAVDREEYEKAAKIRDRINQLEKKQNDEKNG